MCFAKYFYTMPPVTSAGIQLLCILWLKKPVFARGLTARAVVQRLMDIRVTIEAEEPLAVWAATTTPTWHAAKKHFVTTSAWRQQSMQADKGLR